MSVYQYAHFFMTLSQDLDLTLQQTRSSLSHFSELIELNWIEDCLKQTGKASIRKRKLPAEHVVWLVIGLALFRDQPIWYVVQQLQLVCGSTEYCVPSASVQARQRLGLEPLSVLFLTLSQTWFKDSQQQYANFRGLSVCAVDGVVWSMPHTEENFNHFGSSKGKTAVAPYPQVRATCLVNTNTHEVIDAQIGSMDQGELTLANQLKAPSHSITLFDRAYSSADFLINWHAQTEQSHWLMRARDNLRYEVIKRHSKHDVHIKMPVSARAQKLNPLLGEYWEARLPSTDTVTFLLECDATQCRVSDVMDYASSLSEFIKKDCSELAAYHESQEAAAQQTQYRMSYRIESKDVHIGTEYATFYYVVVASESDDPVDISTINVNRGNCPVSSVRGQNHVLNFGQTYRFEIKCNPRDVKEVNLTMADGQELTMVPNG